MGSTKVIKSISAPLSNPGLTSVERLTPLVGAAQVAQVVKDTHEARRRKPTITSKTSPTVLYKKHSDQTPQQAPQQSSGPLARCKQAWGNFLKKCKEPIDSSNSNPWQDSGPKWGDRGKLFANI